MKVLIFSLILGFTIISSFAQKSNDCVTIIETNLSKQPTVVQEIKKLDDKILITSTLDDKEYHLAINTNNTEEFMEHIAINARVSIRPKDGNMYVAIAKKDGDKINVKLFEICK